MRDASILENNIVQTAGSAGESIAFGVGVTMPAIMILGFDLELTRVLLVAVLGGLLGILMMIPLRRALIVNQHGMLKYPGRHGLRGSAEGRRIGGIARRGRLRRRECSGRRRRADQSPRTIFTGFGIGLAYKTAEYAPSRAGRTSPEKIFGAPLKGGSIAAEISPELLGVGYIIGPRIACMMFAGGVLAYLLLIPLIKFFGDGSPACCAPGTMPIAEMGPGDVRSAYVLYIGAGAVAAGGIISLMRSLPHDLARHPVGRARFRARARGTTPGASAAHRAGPAAEVRGHRHPRCCLPVIMLAPSLHMNLLGALLIVMFGLLFVTVSSRLTGEIGSTSNPDLRHDRRHADAHLPGVPDRRAGRAAPGTSPRCRWAASSASPAPTAAPPRRT